MNVKRYFAADMQEVMSKVHDELGPDAVILSSKRVRKKGFKGLFQKPVYEVMVAYDEPAPQRPRAASRQHVPLPHATGGSAPSPVKQAVKPTVTLPQQKAAAAPTISAVSLSSALPAYQRSQGLPASTDVPAAPAEVPAQAAPIIKPAVFNKVDASTAAALTESLDAPKGAPLSPVSFPKVMISASPGAPGAPEDTDKHIARIDQEMGEIRKLLTEVVGRMDGSAAGLDGIPTQFQAHYQRLLRHEVEPDLAARLTREAQVLLFAGKHQTPDQALKAALLSYVRQGNGLPPNMGKRRVVLMVGPTGVGKTTSLVKLAAQAVLRDGMSVGMINADTFRIGAEQQLKTYAEILDAPARMAYSPQEVAEVLEQMQDTNLVFIDTPGKRPGDTQHRQEIEQMVQLCKPDAIYLVISAPTGPQACRRVVEEYSFLAGCELLVTKLDETECAGTVLTACEASGRAIAYIASGQSVPDDLAPAEPERIVTLLAGGDE